MKHLLPSKYLVAVLLAATIALPVQAGPAEDKGLAIAKEADTRNNGYGDTKTSMEMILRNKQGQESHRKLRTRALEQENDGDKGLIIFDSPKDVQGTALLTFSHKVEDDDRWLYLPAVKRVKRIASDNKSGPFMGSEFAFEDLGSQEIEKYTYKYLKDETYEGQDCFVIERIPVDKKSGYTRQVVWMDKAEYRPLKIEFYDRKSSLMKTLTFSGYKQYLDKYWRPHKLDMVNHQTGKSTTLTFGEYQFRNGYTDRDFDQNTLKAAK